MPNLAGVIAKRAPRRRDPQVAGHGERDAGAVAGAVDQGDGRDGERAAARRARRASPRGSAAAARIAAHGREIGQVGAGAEGARPSPAGPAAGAAPRSPRPPRPARPSPPPEWRCAPRAGRASGGRSRRRRVRARNMAPDLPPRAPRLSRKKRAGPPGTRRPGRIVPRRPSGGGGGPRANVGASTAAPRPVGVNRARAVPERNSCGLRWLTAGLGLCRDGTRGSDHRMRERNYLLSYSFIIYFYSNRTIKKKMGISNSNNHGMKTINPHNNIAITTLSSEAKPIPSRLDYST